MKVFAWIPAFAGMTILFFSLLLPQSVFAAGEFSSSYDVTYDVGIDGVTEVTEEITLKNLTDKLYPHEFNLMIGATSLSEVKAFDATGELPSKVEKKNKTSTVNVQFTNAQVVGKDKEYKWTLTFKSPDFAQKIGSSWHITIPKITQTEDLNTYNVSFLVPVELDDATTIIPKPNKISEEAGKIKHTFTKNQLLDKGISAMFGSEQPLSFTIKYALTNTNFLPQYLPIPLPSNTDYQTVVLNQIEPSPETVTIDEWGNRYAWFKVDRRQQTIVAVSGDGLLFGEARQRQFLNRAQKLILTSDIRFWEKDSPQMKARVKELFVDQNLTTTQKAELINEYVVTNLSYDFERLNSKDFDRLGGLTALANPKKALSFEYVDLFSALARAADIPTRQLVGFAESPNHDLRPLSVWPGILHSWVEFYDDQTGWRMIDPAWENTTGGVDYFSIFDLSHFVIETVVTPSEKQTVSDIQVSFKNQTLTERKDLTLEIDSPSQFYASLPAKAKLKIKNTGNVNMPSQKVSISTAQTKIISENNFQIPELAPYGVLEYQLQFNTGPLFRSYDEVIKIQVGDETVQKQITIKPFFSVNYLAISISLLFMGMVFLYVMTIIGHIKMSRK